MIRQFGMTNPLSHNTLDYHPNLIRNHDDLNKLTDFVRAFFRTPTATACWTPWHRLEETQDWTLDAMGNWSTLTTNGTGQSRTHNAQNQVTGVGSTSINLRCDPIV